MSVVAEAGGTSEAGGKPDPRVPLIQACESYVKRRAFVVKFVPIQFTAHLQFDMKSAKQTDSGGLYSLRLKIPFPAVVLSTYNPVRPYTRFLSSLWMSHSISGASLSTGILQLDCPHLCSCTTTLMPNIDVSYVLMEPRSSCVQLYNDPAVSAMPEDARTVHYAVSPYENKEDLLNTLAFDTSDVVERAAPTSCLFTDLCIKTSYMDARKVAAEIKKMSRDSIVSCAVGIESRCLFTRRQRYVYGDNLQYATLYATDKSCVYDVLISGTFNDLVQKKQTLP